MLPSPHAFDFHNLFHQLRSIYLSRSFFLNMHNALRITSEAGGKHSLPEAESAESAGCYARLFIMSPHSNNLYHFFIIKDLVN